MQQRVRPAREGIDPVLHAAAQREAEQAQRGGHDVEVRDQMAAPLGAEPGAGEDQRHADALVVDHVIVQPAAVLPEGLAVVAHHHEERALQEPRLPVDRDELLEESFGPLSIIVRYEDPDALPELHRELFPGNLTSTVHASADELADGRLADLVDALAETSGRVLFGGWPTGVSVTNAMQHGGPFPATTTDATSVGTAAITRFLRGVAYQDAPQSLLPPPLRDDNPWDVPQRRSAAGRSAGWGTLVGEY